MSHRVDPPADQSRREALAFHLSQLLREFRSPWVWVPVLIAIACGVLLGEVARRLYT